MQIQLPILCLGQNAPLLGLLLTVCMTPCCPSSLTADEPAHSVIQPAVNLQGVTHSAIGVTRQGTRIDLFLQQEDLDLHTDKTRLVVVGGVQGGQGPSVAAVLEIMRWFHEAAAAEPFRRQFTLSAIPCASPAVPAAGLEKQRPPDLTFGYPPAGRAYHDPPQPDQATYLWRWLGMHAPDLVVDLRVGSKLAWQLPTTADAALASVLAPRETLTTDGDLVVELGRNKVCQVGRIPAIRLRTPAAMAVTKFESLLQKLKVDPSPARRVLQARIARTPLQIAQQLAEHYGHDLKQVVYIPAIALIGQLRLEDARADQRQRAVKNIVRPYLAGEKDARPSNGSGLSGHLIFTELAGLSAGAERASYIKLARTAADLAFDDAGNIQSIMPFHNEMSDAAFMGGPILSGVGRLTGDDRYLRACATHLQSVRALVLREDGLYRHSPLDQAAWGRGNGFPALALAMCLADFPLDHPARPALLEHCRKHLRALMPHQDPNGCWHQVIDRPESYRELTSTCMIAYAMARGIRGGWLERDEFQPALDRAWQAIATRIAPDGQLVDVCTGTGKQRSLRAYYDRTAILGRDPRGGAMALLVATEMIKNQK